MPVQLIIDSFGIDEHTAQVVETTEASIDAARHAVYQRLRIKDDALFRLRINNPALFRHFREFDGAIGFSVQRLIPRQLLTERFKTALPAWLTDELCVSLGLLKNTIHALTHTLPFEDQLLTACHPNLLNGTDFNVFITALKQQSPVFLFVLKEESIKNRLIIHFQHDLATSKEAALLFIDQLLQSENINVFLEALAYQQCLLQLRRFVSEYQLNLALPAQALPSDLLTAIPLLPLEETEAQQMPELCLSALEIISPKIIDQHYPPEILVQLLVMDWPKVWAGLTHLTEDNRWLISTALVKRLQAMRSVEAQQLAEKLYQQLTASRYPLLSESASVDDVLAWGTGYFDYLRPELLSKQRLDESINGSFTAWLVAQSARIARSNADWRYCAKQINKFLAQNYLVIVVIVDALSALNQDILLAELASLDQLIRTDEILFAPLPTLTEVGKMAVLTGKYSYSLPGDSEMALRQTYSAYLPETNALKVIKSWEDANQHITAQTNLVVFFENRIDERLHDCINFSKHRDDITPIVRQLKRSMQGWLKDAGQRDVVFFITADHGMTVVQGTLQGNLGDVKDRAIKIQHNDDVSDDFVRITQDTKTPYAVVKTRQALTGNTALAHGGLTPEEVLIPFITLTTRPAQPNKMPVEVSVIGSCTRLGDKYWQLELRLKATEQMEDIKLSLEPPFNLEKLILIDIIRAQKTHETILKFTAPCEQVGLTTLDVQLHYNRTNDYEKNTHRLDVVFPKPLLERDANTQNFEDMF